MGFSFYKEKKHEIIWCLIMQNIWKDLPKPLFVLAPMEAVTDVVFRHVVEQAAAPDIYFTEFTNATGWMHAGDKAIGGRLVKTNDEHPIIAQLWGADPVAMEKLAIHCAELGYDGIDINMGCPDMSAVKAGGGSGMIKTPELAGEMIAAAKKSGLPVSVKTRLGYSYVDEWHDWLKFLLEQDIVALTVHLRTKKEMSKVPAHWELMGEIRQLRDEVAPQTLLLGNGDVMSRAHGQSLIDEHGIDGVMIGRGIFKDPFCFAETTDPHVQYAAYKEGTQIDYWHPRSKEDLIELLNYHLDMYDQYAEKTGRPFDTLKRFFKIYVRDFDGAADLRDRLMHCRSTDEVRTLLA